MTVYEGVSDQIRTRNGSPGALELDCSLEDCHSFVASKLADFDLGCEPRFRMTPIGWEPIEDGIALKLLGATSAEEQKLRNLRERLADKLQLRHPGFEQYSFHIGVAYQLKILEEHEKDQLGRYLSERLRWLPQEFELGAPVFCTYEDMVALDGKFDLGRPCESAAASQKAGG
jgi:hypothetical protein